jgi:3-oxoacyl-[acyl-carrier-protein] synthase-3
VNAGIYAVGMYVPPDTRGNDWWSPQIATSWMAQRRPIPMPPELDASGRRVLAAIADTARDPFSGTVERRVMPASMTMLDAEVLAARDAIAKSGVDPRDIDLLLLHAVVPDHQLANPACELHARLGLAPQCLALHVEATGYTSLAQLGLAEAAIVANRSRFALCVQSCAATRLVERDDPSSPLVGDAATAFVIGPVAANRGVLATAHFTEGNYPDSLIMSVPGARWYDPGQVRVHVGNPAQLFAAHLRTAVTCAEAVNVALERANYQLDDIDALCVVQGTAWLQRVVYDELAVRLQPMDTFSRFAYLSSAAIPAALFEAVRAGEIVDDDLVVVVSGGTGMTYGAAVMRWGRS